MGMSQDSVKLIVPFFLHPATAVGRTPAPEANDRCANSSASARLNSRPRPGRPSSILVIENRPRFLYRTVRPCKWPPLSRHPGLDPASLASLAPSTWAKIATECPLWTCSLSLPPLPPGC